MIANFTQYLRPNGRQKAVEIDVANDLQSQIGAIKAAGCQLECEILMTGIVSLTIFDIEIEENYSIELVNNGREVPQAVDKLIRRFDFVDHGQWRKEAAEAAGEK